MVDSPLEWARRLQGIAQNGLTYARDPYDVERYQAIRAVAAQIMGAQLGVAPHAVVDLFSQDSGHATPKVDVRGVVFRDRQMLLVRERSDGLWTLPGGWADVGESPAESVVREIDEESGYTTRAVKLLAVYDRDKQGHPPLPWHVYKLFFLCELASTGEPRRDRSAARAAAPEGASHDETDDAAFFAENAIPRLSLSRVTPAQIARFFQHEHHPEWPTEFD